MLAGREASGEAPSKAQILLDLLESVERDGAKSQRRLAGELGIALGLVNAYIRRCIKKGLVKVTQTPAGRIAYYLTPNGFAEKSRLTIEYLSYSFSFFRQAKADCSAVIELARVRGFTRVVLAGRSDLAEIAAICGLESNVTIVAVVDAKFSGPHFLSFAAVQSYDDLPDDVDAVIVTDLSNARETAKQAIARYGADRVLIPELLCLRITDRRKVAP
jgi:DNA-binding MarR family transcriptional regulator